jgi:hypothetical protein
MKAEEIKIMEQRISAYRLLQNAESETVHSIQCIEEEPTPFTGNARESRRINSIDVHFSKTEGGSPPVAKTISLNIAAHEFGQALTRILETRLINIRAQMENT